MNELELPALRQLSTDEEIDAYLGRVAEAKRKLADIMKNYEAQLKADIWNVPYVMKDDDIVNLVQKVELKVDKFIRKHPKKTLAVTYYKNVYVRRRLKMVQYFYNKLDDERNILEDLSSNEEEGEQVEQIRADVSEDIQDEQV